MIFLSLTKKVRKRTESMAKYFSCSISFVIFPFFLIVGLPFPMIFIFSSFINEEHSTDLLYSSFTPSIHLRKTNHLTDRSTPPRVSLDGVLSNSTNKSSTHKVGSSKVRNIHFLSEVIILICLKFNDHELPCIDFSVPFTLLLNMLLQTEGKKFKESRRRIS